MIQKQKTMLLIGSKFKLYLNGSNCGYCFAILQTETLRDLKWESMQAMDVHLSEYR